MAVSPGAKGKRLRRLRRLLPRQLCNSWRPTRLRYPELRVVLSPALTHEISNTTMAFMSDSVTTTEKPAEKPEVFSARPVRSNGRERETPVEKETEPGPPKTVIREYFESAVVTVIMALFGMTFIVQAVKVPTGSMQNTITIGDHLLV